MRTSRPLPPVRHLFPLLCLWLLLTGCGRASGGLEEGLYLRTHYAFGSLDIGTVYFGPGNRIIMNPDGGVDPFDTAKADPKSVGTYQFNGKDKITVQWGGGRQAETLSVEFNKRQLSAFDGGLMSKAESYGKNQTLEGTYSGSLSAGGGAVSAARGITFTKDGKFTMDTGGAISTANVDAYSGGAKGGTYTLTGNTLTLKYSDGTTERRTVLPFNTALDPAKAELGDQRLIFEHMSLKRVK